MATSNQGAKDVRDNCEGVGDGLEENNQIYHSSERKQQMR
jgi:hypothetical protein